MPPKPADPEEPRSGISKDEQLTLFRMAVKALGGNTRAAAEIGFSERSIERILAGTHNLNSGILTDTCKALVRHARICHELERKLDPIFADNRTEGQRARDGRRDAAIARRDHGSN